MKRDPNTGKFLPKSKRAAALRTAASSIGRVFRGNPSRPKKRTARKTSPKRRTVKRATRKVARHPRRRTARH